MGALPTPEPAGIRYAAYIEELREFFDTSRLHYGQPLDIVALTDRLRASEPFFDDLSSLIRSMVLREGGAMPHAQLLEILALAIGGPHMEQSPKDYAQPLRQLLLFITTALRRPWNEPPGELVPFPSESAAQAEVVPFPTEIASPRNEPSADTMPSPIPAPPLEPSPVPDPVPIPGPEPTPPAPPAPDFRAKPEPAPRPPILVPQPSVIAPQPIAAALAALTVQTPPTAPQARKSLLWIYLAAGGAVALVLVLAFAFHFHSAPQPITQAVIPVPATTPAPPQSAPAVDSKPTALVPQASPRPRHVVSDEDEDDDETDVAPPSIHNSPGWPPSGASTQAAPQSANPAQPATSGPAPIERRAPLGPSNPPQRAYRDPDGSIVGDALPVRPSSREPYRVSSGVMASNLISNPAPDYPAVARLAHVEGQVVLQAVISRDGSVSAAHVLSGHRLLRGAALDAVRRWRYHPYLSNGHPVDVATIITVDFRR